jgi:hypothetical protein
LVFQAIRALEVKCRTLEVQEAENAKFGERKSLDEKLGAKSSGEKLGMQKLR